MAPDWQNNSCSPIPPFANTNGSGSCTLGNLAHYAINISEADAVIAGIRFARERNIRLTIKNTGHDYLGRSAGKGSLALWTHNLKKITFLDYGSAKYHGPAVRVGAGVEGIDLVNAASKKHLRVVHGSCPTVGVSGGWLQGGGHGPLTAAYGLGADNVLEFEVVTADGQHITASPLNEYEDLYWALSGGGGGNYGVVLSSTLKAYTDGPVAGGSFSFLNSDSDKFWSAVTAWLQHLLVLNRTPGLKTIVTITPTGFAMNFATWPGGTVQDVMSAFNPYFEILTGLGIPLIDNTTTVHPDFLSHLEHFSADIAYTVNVTVASRLIPRSLVQDNATLSALVSTIRDISNRNPAIFNIISSNVSHSATVSNSVLTAWRNSLFHMNFGLSLNDNASWEELELNRGIVSNWQDQFRLLTPGGGSYVNEASVMDKTWKEDYYGSNYKRLEEVKVKYDADSVFWANVAVGSDRWAPTADGRMCRTQ
jgi:hypothetical protein